MRVSQLRQLLLQEHGELEQDQLIRFCPQAVRLPRPTLRGADMPRRARATLGRNQPSPEPQARGSARGSAVGRGNQTYAKN